MRSNEIEIRQLRIDVGKSITAIVESALSSESKDWRLWNSLTSEHFAKIGSTAVSYMQGETTIDLPPHPSHAYLSKYTDALKDLTFSVEDSLSPSVTWTHAGRGKVLYVSENFIWCQLSGLKHVSVVGFDVNTGVTIQGNLRIYPADFAAMQRILSATATPANSDICDGAQYDNDHVGYLNLYKMGKPMEENASINKALNDIDIAHLQQRVSVLAKEIQDVQARLDRLK